jgi:hypothetical protein
MDSGQMYIASQVGKRQRNQTLSWRAEELYKALRQQGFFWSVENMRSRPTLSW